MSHNQFKRYNNQQSGAYHQNRYTRPLWQKQQPQKSKNFHKNRHDYSTGESRQQNSRSPTPIRHRNQEKQPRFEQRNKYEEERNNLRKNENRFYRHKKQKKYEDSRGFHQKTSYNKNSPCSHHTDQNSIEDDLSTQPSVEQQMNGNLFKLPPNPQDNPKPQQFKQVEVNPEKKAEDLLQLIQLLNYDNLTDQVQRQFLEICKEHICFIAGKPQSRSIVGEILIRNGLFHEMWSKLLLKNTVFDRDIIIPVYYQKYKNKIQKNTTNFQIAFNPIPQCPSQIQQFKRYRKLFDVSTNFTTKLNCMKLYEEIRRQFRDQQTEQLSFILSKRKCQWDIATAQIQIGIKQREKKIEDYDQTETIKALQKIGYQMDPDTKIITAKRQKSPQTGRFRLMEQTQTNQRRAAVQMACVFLNIDRIFHISDVDIVRVRECYKNQKVQLAVVQAYVVEFDKKQKKMKIQPKQRTLVAAYKFVGLQQLIRIEKTYGQIYGLLVYDQHVDIKKYLDNLQKSRIICN